MLKQLKIGMFWWAGGFLLQLTQPYSTGIELRLLYPSRSLISTLSSFFCYPISFRFFMLKVNHYASRKPAMFVFLQPTALRDTRTHAHVLLSYCRDCHSYDLLLIPLHAPFLSQFSGRPKHFAQQKIRSLFEFCQSQLPFYKFLISKPLS